MKVKIYRCTDACGNYFASSSTRSDLSAAMNHKSSMNNGVGETAFQETHLRSQCPVCKAEREPIVVDIPGVAVASAA